MKEVNYSGNKVILTSSEGKELTADKVQKCNALIKEIMIKMIPF